MRQINATFQFNIATLGEFYIDLKNGQFSFSIIPIDAFPLSSIGNGACDTGRYPFGSSADVTITLSNPEDLRLLSAGDPNELVQAYLSQRITIDGSLQDAMNLKYLAETLRRDHILLFNPTVRK